MTGMGYRSFGAHGADSGQLDQPLDVVLARIPE